MAMQLALGNFRNVKLSHLVHRSSRFRYAVSSVRALPFRCWLVATTMVCAVVAGTARLQLVRQITNTGSSDIAGSRVAEHAFTR